MEQEAIDDEHAGEEKSERGISPDVFGSQYWEDNQQNRGSCRAREGMLSAGDGCSWLKMEGGDVFHTKILSIQGS